MSASLVGSEMCIRDREGLVCNARRTTRGARMCCATCSWRKPGSAREQPVSYTHLTLPTICSV
eukprot:8319834-Alexandrium_andersonii.AAC.1